MLRGGCRLPGDARVDGGRRERKRGEPVLMLVAKAKYPITVSPVPLAHSSVPGLGYGTQFVSPPIYR